MSQMTSELDPIEALTGSMRDFRELRGTDLLQRVEGFYRWQELRRLHRLWPYSKSTEEAPRAVCAAKDESGRSFRGLNFAEAPATLVLGSAHGAWRLFGREW